MLSSVSAYYYSGAVALFTGVLVALSLTLLSYKGYRDVRADRIVGKTSGAAAACVAFLPTEPPPGLRPGWWMSWMGYAHVTSAIVLFVSFIVFALWLFRMTAVIDRRKRPVYKKTRDADCLGCGIVMICAVLWAGAAGLAHRSIFWPEAFAIEAFAVSCPSRPASSIVTQHTWPAGQSVAWRQRYEGSPTGQWPRHGRCKAPLAGLVDAALAATEGTRTHPAKDNAAVRERRAVRIDVDRVAVVHGPVAGAASARRRRG